MGFGHPNLRPLLLWLWECASVVTQVAVLSRKQTSQHKPMRSVLSLVADHPYSLVWCYVRNRLAHSEIRRLAGSRTISESISRK